MSLKNKLSCFAVDKSYWLEHFDKLSPVFPSAPVNGIWSLCYALLIFVISKRYTLIETTMITWIAGFVLMWLVIGNLLVLPYAKLFYAVPLSILEVYIGVLIIYKIDKKGSNHPVYRKV